MIFDPTTYSPHWPVDFAFAPAEPSAEPSAAGPDLPRIHSHSTLGGLKPPGDAWRFEPGLGTDFELSHSLLLCCGFRLTFANDQVFELMCAEPGIFLGRIPVRATPELFSPDRETEVAEESLLLEAGEYRIGLQSRINGQEKWFVLCIHRGDREACLRDLESHLEKLPQRLPALWESQLALRDKWMARLPDHPASNAPGLAIERLQGLIEPAAGIFSGPWIRDPEPASPALSLNLCLGVLPALSVIQPERVPQLLRTLTDLPPLEDGAWAAVYTAKGADPEGGPALPALASMAAGLPAPSLDFPERSAFISRCQQHLQTFLNGPAAGGLPQWPRAASAFTPEVTDPEALVQFDLAALLVCEIEALQELGENRGLLESERKKLAAGIFAGFWSEKRKRLLDKTPSGETAGRVTAGALFPLLWRGLDRKQAVSLRQALQNPDELRDPEGIRQWQPRKGDPVPPPVRPSTQHFFLHLLGSLPGEAAALLSADWHRSLEADPEASHPETAALQIRLLPYADRVNPHLERYPSWVRSLEKHRQVLVTVAAAILLLIPAGFGIYFSVRGEYNRADELLLAGHAETLVTMRNLPEAEAAYTRLIEYARLDARKNIYHLKRADLRFKQGKYEEALEDYLRTIELDPLGTLYKARWNLGQTYARLGQKQEAVRILREFIDEYGDELPGIARRAEYAITLWQR